MSNKLVHFNLPRQNNSKTALSVNCKSKKIVQNILINKHTVSTRGDKFPNGTYRRSYSLTSHVNGDDTQWMKALGFGAVSVDSQFTNNSVILPLESWW